MKILLIEDNSYKREKVISFLKKEFNSAELLEAYSFSSGVTKALDSEIDFIVLDMSLPSYDRCGVESGGRFRTYGGKEIARKIFRKGLKTPFVILTNYNSFSDDQDGFSTLESISNFLKLQNGAQFLGAIYYSGSESSWKKKLKEIINDNL